MCLLLDARYFRAVLHPVKAFARPGCNSARSRRTHRDYGVTTRVPFIIK
jgi:hypothetical protein